MAISKDEALQKALKRLGDSKAAKENKNEFSDNYEQKHVDYFEFSKQGKWVPFRLLGLPWETREKPTDTKLFLISKIVSDDGNWYLPVIWPSVWSEKKQAHIPDPDWILTRLYQDIMDGEWKNPTKEEKQADSNLKGQYIHKYENSPVFERVKKNARKDEKFPKSFYPSQRVIGNVFDPLDKEFHAINKRSKVLCSKVGRKEREDGQVTYYPELGMPLGVYNDILQLAGAAEGLFSEFDIAVRLDDKIYKTAHYTDLEVRKLFKELNNDPIEGLEMYDLDELVPVTRYSTLKKVVGKLFTEWDAYAKRDYMDQLVELCRIEAEETKAKYAEQGKKDPEDTSTQHPVKKEEPAKEVPEKTEAEVQPKRGQRSEAAKPSYEELFEKAFPGFNKLPEEEKAFFNEVFDGFDDKGEPKWKGDVVPCNGEGNCGRNTIQSNKLTWCASCGFQFPID